MNTTTLPLDRLMSGMVLASDIHDAHGTVLLAAGTELSEVHLAALRRRKVPGAVIKARAPLPAAEQEARREAIHARLRHLFRGVGEDEAASVLFRTILEYRLEQVE